MVAIDIGSMCCDCGVETFSVFGPRWAEDGWDDYDCTNRPERPEPITSTITIKYSFMPEGVPLTDPSHFDFEGASNTSLDWNFPFGQISQAEFKKEIELALSYWEEVFEEEFPGLDINFVDLGMEDGVTPSGDSHPIGSEQGGIGDIRFGVEHMFDGSEVSGVLAHAWPTYNPLERLGVNGSFYKDVHFNPDHHWRIGGEDYGGGGEGGAATISSEAGDEVLSLEGHCLCSLSTEEERKEFFKEFGPPGSHGHAHFPDQGFSIAYVAAHELGHVFGLMHTSSGLMAASASTANELVPLEAGPVLTQFRAIYDADTVVLCTSLYGLIDICEVTVDEDEELGGELAGALVESPAHLLGTVYYAKERRYDTATIQGLVSIKDNLIDSPTHFCPGNPSCRGTVTTWGNVADEQEPKTLYILSPPNPLTTYAPDRAAIQKVDLLADTFEGEALVPPCPVAQWWVWESDFHDNFNVTGVADAIAFAKEDLIVSFDMTKMDLSDEAVPLGLGRPTGLGWDSSTELPYPANDKPYLEFPKGIQVNPRGESLDERQAAWENDTGGSTASKSNFVLGFDCGYGDDGLGFTAGLPDKNPTMGRKLHPNTDVDVPDDVVDTLGLGKADTAGDALFHPPGHEIQLGWGVPVDHAPNIQGDATDRIMTDSDFFASTGAPSKVIPQIVARNNWPYAAGGYTTVDTVANTEVAELTMLARIDWEWAKDIVGDATKETPPILGDPYKAGEGKVYLWPPRFSSDENEAQTGCTSYNTFSEVGAKIRTELGAKTGVWTGESITGDGAGSSFTLFSADIIGRTLTDTGHAPASIWDSLFPLYVPETVDGQNVWPTCAGDSLSGGYAFWEPGYSWVGYWKIRRKVGVLKHTQKTYLVTGEVSGSDGTFPHVPVSDPTELSEVVYYTKPLGFELGGAPTLTAYTTIGDFPWAEVVDFVTTIEKEWSYYLPVLTGAGAAAAFKVAYTSVYTGLPNRSDISYYNRTENVDVFVVRIQSSTEDLAPRYFSKTDFPGTHGGHAFPSGDSSPATLPPDYASGAEDGETPLAEGGSTYESYPFEGPGWCGQITPVTVDESDDVATPYKKSQCNLGEKANINTYERWSAGGGWLLPSSGDAERPGIVDTENTQGLGLYDRTQLWFGDSVIYDTMEETDFYEQEIIDGEAFANWKVEADDEEVGRIVRDVTHYVPERGYPRTEIDDIEVLPGDRIAVLTRVISEPGGILAALMYGPQRLTVFGAEGRKWFVEAVGDFVPVPNTPAAFPRGAKIVTSSDRWVHIIGFPLNVDEVLHGEIPKASTPLPVANNWLISLEDGITENSPAVPARIDEGPEIEHIGEGHETDNASWASLWEHLKTGGTDSFLGEDSNFDAPRKSSVIDDCIPNTMHPSEFF